VSARPAFVGRRDELRELQGCLASVEEKLGTVILVSGALGIGKTRLIEEFAETAREACSLVAWGRWYESGHMPSYVGFQEAVCQLLGSETIRQRVDRSSPYVHDLARMVPEAASLGLTDRSPARVPGDDQYRLWRGISLVIGASVEIAPTVLVLDDLHWADEGSLGLLSFLGRAAKRQRFLILGAYREEDVPRDHALRQTIAELSHDQALTSIRLQGLTKDEVGAMAVAVAGADVAAEFIEDVHRQTEGNPLFVEEIVRHITQKQVLGGIQAQVEDIPPGDLDMPQGLQEVIGRRLSRLSPECRHLLDVASVIGREFDLLLIQRVSELPQGALLLALDEAVTASAVREVTAGAFSVAHPLIGAVAYSGISPSERLRCHAKVAEALEERCDPGAESRVRDTARHLLAASGLADAGKTAEYCLRGGRQAIALAAYDEAQSLLRAGLSIADRLNPPDPQLRARLLSELGYAGAFLGHQREAIRAYRESIAIREMLGDRVSSLDVRRWLATILNHHGRGAESLAVTREALATATEERTSAYMGVVANHFVALMLTGAVAEAGAWAEKALELAFDLETAGVAHHVAGIWHTLGGGDHQAAEERFRQARRLFLDGGFDLASAQAASDQALSFYFLGRFDQSMEAEQESERLGRAAGHGSLLADMHALRSLRHVHKGEWEEARVERQEWRDAAGAAGGSTVYGQVGAWSEVVERLWREGPSAACEALDQSLPLSGPLLAYIHAEAGEQDRSSRLLGPLSAAVPRDGRGLIWLAAALPIASALCSLGDGKVADWEPALGRYRGCLGHALLPDIELGRLCAGGERWQEAERHFKDAARLCQEQSFRPFLGQAYYQWALMLLTRRGPGDRRRAGDLLQQADQALAPLGAAFLQEKVRAILDSMAKGRPPSVQLAGLTEREIAILALVAQGRSNREIAESLFLSEKTVERHLANIYTKIGVQNRAAATAFALRHGLT
jgi:DNA-binding CsgD family transcriptional regulator